MTSGNTAVEDDLPRILTAIRELPQHGQFEICEARNKVELCPAGINSASFLARWIGGKRFDLVIAIGTKRVDQSLFNVLSHEAVTVSVSPAMTSGAGIG